MGAIPIERKVLKKKKTALAFGFFLSAPAGAGRGFGVARLRTRPVGRAPRRARRQPPARLERHLPLAAAGRRQIPAPNPALVVAARPPAASLDAHR